jgi:hypothetical protein
MHEYVYVCRVGWEPFGVTSGPQVRNPQDYGRLRKGILLSLDHGPSVRMLIGTLGPVSESRSLSTIKASFGK